MIDDPRLPLRFWAKVVPEPNSGCWLWTGATTQGYGQIRVAYERRRAHRMTYEAFVGPIPDGLVIDHLCRTRCCVNPAHMEPVTNRENAIRGERGRMTHCKRGHPLDEGNTYAGARSMGHRLCKICQRAKQIAYKRAKSRDVVNH